MVYGRDAYIIWLAKVLKGSESSPFRLIPEDKILSNSLFSFTDCRSMPAVIRPPLCRLDVPPLSQHGCLVMFKAVCLDPPQLRFQQVLKH
jgi:hypothetical protein